MNTSTPATQPAIAARPANRIARSKQSVMGKMLLLAEQHRASGRTVVDLTVGAPLAAPPTQLLEAGCKAITSGRNNYGDANGAPALRHAQARLLESRYGLQYNDNTEVTVTAGASAALQSTLLALCNPGDGVALFEPFYEGFLPLIRLAGGRPKFIRLESPEWKFNEKTLSRALSGRTRFLILNTPHNPCGRVFGVAELETIARLCAERGIIVIADETYEHYVFGNAKHRTIGSFDGMREQSVLIYSASKIYNVPGWRIGTVVAPAAISQAIRQVNTMTLGAPIPFQHALADYLNSDSRSAYENQLAAPYEPLMMALCDALIQAGFGVSRPEGTLSFMASAGRWGCGNIDTSEKLTDFVLNRFGILAVPGSTFYHKAPPEPCVRFCFARDKQTIDLAVECLARAV